MTDAVQQLGLDDFLLEELPTGWSWRDHFPRLQAVTETSRKAYAALIVEGERETQAQRLLHLLLEVEEGLTYNELSRILDISINAVCGRMNELRRIEALNGQLLIVDAGTRVDDYSDVHNMVWQVNPAFKEAGR